MAARSEKIKQPSVRMVRRASAALCVVLAFATGLFFGWLAANFTQRVPALTEQAAAGNPQAHVSDIERMTREQPNNPAAWIHLGDEYYDAQQPAQAISAYERALALKPDNPDVHTDLGTSYRLVGKYDQAIAHYNEALAHNSRHQNARMNKGIVLYYDLGRKQEALDTWNILLSIVPDAKAPDGSPLKEFVAKHVAP